MPPKQTKSDREVKGQESSPDLASIQPVPDNATSSGNDVPPGLGLWGVLSGHHLPVIHKTNEPPSIGVLLPELEGIYQGPNQTPLLYPDLSSSYGNITTAAQDPFSYERLLTSGQPEYSAAQSAPGDYDFNTMPRNNPPPSGTARNQGGAGTGAGVTKRQTHHTRQASSVMGQALSQAASGQTGSPGQPHNQTQGYDVDLTGMGYTTGSPSTLGLPSSSMGTSLDPASLDPSFFDVGSYNTGSGVVRGLPQTPQRQDYRNVEFENPDLLTGTPDFLPLSQYESFAEEEEQREVKPDSRGMRDEGGTPTPYGLRQASAALTDISPAATGHTTSSPPAANNNPFENPFDSPEQGGAGGSSTDGQQQQAAVTTSNPQRYAAHVAPNRIQEAGPVRHPDPEWRPYGTNHWHVFLCEPTLLRYLSSTEIKDIREHCYELAKLQAAGEDEPVPVAEGSPYSTVDAQAVWRHCDAYVRRRSQVRNNQAARRSRQRKDAETKYWKAKALEYGCPDHEFNWEDYEEIMSSPAGQAVAAAAEGSTPGHARARSRGGQQGQAQGQAQQQQGQGQVQVGRGSVASQGHEAARRSSGPSPVKPEFDFNQPFHYDDDEANDNFDAFIGGF